MQRVIIIIIIIIIIYLRNNPFPILNIEGVIETV